MLFVTGCREEGARTMDKLDPRLKMQVDRMQGETLSVFLHTTGKMDEAQRRKIETYGVVIQSNAGTVYVCRIPLRAIVPVVKEKFVVLLEAPKELTPQ